MTTANERAEFPEYADENRRLWDANASWWDDRIGGGNDFQELLIEPATERLLGIVPGDVVVDGACGAGRLARRLAALGAHVVAFDYSTAFIARARERTPAGTAVEYHVLDAADTDALVSLGLDRFDKAVCTMALMDMPEIRPLFAAFARMLKPGGAFVFSVTHPCFHSAGVHRFAEMYEEPSGRHVVRSGVQVTAYLTPSAMKTEGIAGQPEPQLFFHRPLSVLFRAGFEHGFVVDEIEEPGLPGERAAAGTRWDDMPEIPPIMVVRMRLASRREPSAGAP
jgi:2-polyprenyl-3-methyl-5-hydroxy-6-metoxy-1,4-benzoquinol methylase